MANLGKILLQALTIGEQIAPLVGPGGAAAATAAQAVQELLQELKGSGSAADDSNLQSQIDDLQTRMNQETDDVIRLARGTSGAEGSSGND